MTDDQPTPRPFGLAAFLGLGGAALALLAMFTVAADDAPKPAAAPAAAATKEWHVHDRERPQPPVITPGTFSTQEQVGTAPSDAIVLFDGKDLSKWSDKTGKAEPKWTVKDGYFEVAKGTGLIQTKDSFGDCQLHVEWMAPNPPVGKDQDRGNSGIHLMGRYELQVLDNYQAQTYADGMAGAIYGQYPPQVNAARPPGQWQTYDVVFHAPRFNEDGSVARPARITSFFNGVLVQDDVELKGSTGHMKLAAYAKHADKLPITLQDHGHPVRYRNIWLRPIAAEKPVAPTMPGVPH